MNPGLPEEGAKVANSIVEGLKSQPVTLALIVMNVLFLAFVVWVLHEISTTNKTREEQSTQLIRELQESLRVCRDLIPPRNIPQTPQRK